MTRTFVILALGLALPLAGCKETAQSRGDDRPGATAAPMAMASPTSSSALASAAAPASLDPAVGANIYHNRCEACHGGAGQGGMGPALGATDKQGHAAVVKIIADGRADKGMPGWEGMLSPDEIEAVAAFVEKL